MKTTNLIPSLAIMVCLASTALSGTIAYRDLILSDNPIVYYELDESSGTTASNSATTGAMYDGTFNTAGGSITVNQGSFALGGTCYDFGGGFVGAASALTNSLTEWTVEAWVNYDSAKTIKSNFLGNDQGGWNDDVIIGIGPENGGAGVPAGSVGVIHQGNPGTTRDFAGAALAANEWHHVVMTGSTIAGTLTLYIDGVFAASDTSLFNGVTFNGADGFDASGTGGANDPHLTIGSNRPDASVGDLGGYWPYDGLLDELAIYNRALDVSEVLEHYLGTTVPLTTDYATAILDETGLVAYYRLDESAGTVATNAEGTAALDGSYEGTLTLTAAGPRPDAGFVGFEADNTAMSHAGVSLVGAKVLNAALGTLTSWTLEAWANSSNVDAHSDTSDGQHIFSRDEGGYGNDLLIGLHPFGSQDSTLGHWDIHYQYPNPNTLENHMDPTKAISGQWYHVVATYDNASGTMTLYINGVQAVQTSGLGARPLTGGDLWIGGYWLVGHPRGFVGTVDEAAVYNRALDPNEVQEHYYAATFSAGTPPVIEPRIPLDGAVDVSPFANLEARFNELMALTGAGTVTIRNLTLGSGDDVTIALPDPQVSVAGVTLTINPATALDAATTYAVQISADAIKDIADDAFAGILNDEDWNFTTTGGAPPSSGRIRVFILAGQSNMAGHGSTSELTAPYDTAQSNVGLWDNGTWVDLAPGFGTTSTEFGPEVSFGYTVQQGLSSDTVLLIKYAVGGTALYDDWAPSSGPQYTAFMSTASAALANLNAYGIDYEISAMLWLQGESDALENQGAAYETNLRNFIDDMRVQFSVPDLPFYMARVRTYYGTAEQAGLVRDAQVAVAESTANVEWFDTDSYNPLIIGGHYNTDGQISIGIDYANTYRASLASQRPSTIVGWSAISNNLMRMVVDTPVPGFICPLFSTNMQEGAWTNVAHSDTQGNPFVVTNLNYSTIEGANAVIYLRADTTRGFFRLQDLRKFTLWQLPSQTSSQMMSYVAQSSGDKLIVIDGGNTGDGPYLKSFLAARGNHVDSWFISHSHKDHVDALTWILANQGDLIIDNIYASFPPSAWIQQYYDANGKAGYQTFINAMATAGRSHTVLNSGDVFNIDEINIEILSEGYLIPTPNPVNDSSVIMRFADPTKTVLFTGDIGPLAGDEALVRIDHDKLKADYVQMAHHGQVCARSNFYAVVQADYALWPTPSWLWDWETTQTTRQWMDDLGVKVHYVSGLSGLVEVK